MVAAQIVRLDLANEWGVTTELATFLAKLANGHILSQRSEPTECPCLQDSLFGGESGGRAIGSTRY